MSRALAGRGIAGLPGGPPGGRRGREEILAWYRSEARDLPWRHTRDRWAVLVSETMLRQTQASRVAERYGSLLGAFPTPAAMAHAPLEAVLRHWEGLGYYRRARDLWRSAVVIVADHAGVVPGDLAALRALPGVGRYTARAVLAFADERPLGPVDTNVRRVLSRWAEVALSISVAESWADRLAERSVADRSGPWTWNQAMIELGARCCTARSPRCGACPVQPWCPSAGVAERVVLPGARQKPFVGSDRQGAARLLRALLRAPVRMQDAPRAAGFDDDPARAGAVVARLVSDGLVAEHDGWLVVARVSQGPCAGRSDLETEPSTAGP